MEYIKKISIVISLLLCGIAYGESGFLFREVIVDKKAYRYQVYIPPGLSPDKDYPAVLFLHGAAERGEDGLEQTGVGLGRAIRGGSFKKKAYVIFPQCPHHRWWSDNLCERIAMKAYFQTEMEFPIDTDRIYLTGLSMGGYGSWYLAARYNYLFAAIVPIAARSIPGEGRKVPLGSILYGVKDEEVMSRIVLHTGDIPAWIVHGDKDNIVPVKESRKIYEQMTHSATQRDVVYKELKGVYHNSWDYAYQDQAMIDWMFSKNKRKKSK